MDEDYGRADGENMIKLNQDVKLLFSIVTVHVHLFNASHSQFVVLKSESNRVRREHLGIIHDVLRESSTP